MFRPLNIIISIFLSSKVYRILLAFLSALILCASLSCFGYYSLAWLGLTPLILLNKSAKSFLDLILESFVFFCIYNLISFIWIFSIHPLTWIGLDTIESGIIATLAWLIPSIYQSCFLLLFSISIWLIYQFKSKKKLEELSLIEIIILSFIWALIQYKIFANGANPFSVFSIPMNQLAYSQANNIEVKELFAIIGSVGLEILIVGFNLVLANLIHIHNFCNPKAKMFYQNQASHGVIEINSLAKSLFNIGLILIILLLIKLSQLYKIDTNKMNPINARIIQANLNRKDTRAELNNLTNIIEKQKKLSLTKLGESSMNLLVWSEAGIPSAKADLVLTEISPKLENHYDNFLYGTYREDKFKTYNSLSLINLKNKKEQDYNKKFLVPFGEYTPFINIFPSSIRRLAHNTIGSGFDAMTAKQKLLNIKDEKVKFSSSICFELLFPNLIKEQVNQGASFIINVNDLSWFSNHLVNDLFLAIAKVRALENKKELVLSSNSGYSTLISANGDIEQLTELDSENYIDLVISPNSAQTFYTRYGW